MALDPQSKNSLAWFTAAARKIINNPDRMEQFMKMLGSPEGAITAVQSVLAVIEKKRPIPPNILAMLADNCYLWMVKVANASTDVRPDVEIMQSVRKAIAEKMQQISGGQPGAPQQTPQAAPAPRGIIASRQGVPA